MPNMAFKERIFDRLNQAIFSDQCVFECNIDGELEHNIIRKLQEIDMVTTAYMYKGHANKSVAYALFAGFSRQLKGWWDHYLKEHETQFILNAIKVESEDLSSQ